SVSILSSLTPEDHRSSAIEFYVALDEDVKDWTIDVLTDALTRAEECVKQGSK
nr:hypothetical protein [Tanacetum cinerariifolium]